MNIRFLPLDRKDRLKSSWYLIRKFKNVIFLICSLLLLSSSHLLAQAHDEHASDPHEFKHHRVAVIIGHGHVFGAENVDNGNIIITIPTWGIDYQYWINDKYGVSIKSDVEIMDYVITITDENTVERTTPFIVSTVFLYHPSKGWNFLAGPGIEFEESHNLFIIRAGVSYDFEFGKHWDFSPEFVFDLKEGKIGSFTWGIGVGKRF
jgi:hypothetical protein